MKTFVTGGTGLLGNNLIRVLESAGHGVRALVRSPEKGKRLLADTAAELVSGDMRNISAWADALSGCELLFHAAAYFREYYQPGKHWDNLETLNVRATVDLMEAAERAGVKRAVFVSTGGIIGSTKDHGPADENTPPDPIAYKNLYFRSKLRAEKAIEELQAGSSLEIIRVLPGWMLGPHDAAPTDGGQLVLGFLRRRLPGVINGGSSVADVRDVADGMLRAALSGRPGQRYILGGEYQSLSGVLETLERVTGVRAPRVRFPYLLALSFAVLSEGWSRISGARPLTTVPGVRTIHAGVHLDSSKAREQLGVSFRSLDETLADTVAWFRQNGYT
jgi:dihydroflavonol-4-reductase